MSFAPPVDTVARRRALKPGVEYEFDKLTISRQLSRTAVTRLLVERAPVNCLSDLGTDVLGS